MTNVLLIIFIISLLYVSIANRIITYVRVLALAGFHSFWSNLPSAEGYPDLEPGSDSA